MGPGHESREDIDRLLARFIRGGLPGGGYRKPLVLNKLWKLRLCHRLCRLQLFELHRNFLFSARLMDDLRVIPH
jgi:hypothetical protein